MGTRNSGNCGRDNDLKWPSSKIIRTSIAYPGSFSSTRLVKSSVSFISTHIASAKHLPILNTFKSKMIFQRKSCALFSACICILTICSSAHGQATPPPLPPMKTASLNKYLDVIFANISVNAVALNIEPLNLPNISTPLTSKWYFPYDHMTLTDGTLQNIQTIKRRGDCTVSFFNDTIEIKVDAAFTDLEVEYLFNAQSSYSWFSLAGLVQGQVGEVQISADVTIDANTLAVRAQQISFPGTKKIDFCIKSTILATWVVNAILEVVELFSGFIIDAVQNAVTNAVNEFFEHSVPHMISQQNWISPPNTFELRIVRKV